MSDLTNMNPTREDFLDSSILLLEDMQDTIGALIVALRNLPESRIRTGELLLQIEAQGRGAWAGLQTYVDTMDCEGNS